MDLHTLERLRGVAASCPSDLDLDQLSSDELLPSAAAPIAAHVAGCAECTARMQTRKSGFAAFPELDAPPILSAIRRRIVEEEQKSARRSFWRRPTAWLAAPLAAAAVLAIFFLVRRDVPSGDLLPEDGVRAKGGLILHVYRLVGERSQRAASGDVFHPGDRLRFVVDLPQPGHINVLGVEAKGGLYVGWPADDGVTTLRSVGSGQELPGAVALDATTGRETLYLAHCPTAIGVPKTVCTARDAGQPPACPPGCALTPFILNKQ